MGELDKLAPGGDILAAPPGDRSLVAQWFNSESGTEIIGWMIANPSDASPIAFDTVLTKNLKSTVQTLRDYVLEETKTSEGISGWEKMPSQTDLLIVLNPTLVDDARPTIVISQKFNQSPRMVTFDTSGPARAEQPKDLLRAKYEIPAGYRAAVFSTQPMIGRLARSVAIHSQTDKAKRSPLQNLYNRATKVLDAFDKEAMEKRAAQPLGKIAGAIFDRIIGRREDAAA